MYSLHYGQQCPPEWDDGSVPAETADRQKKKEHGRSNPHAEEDLLQKIESLNLDPRLKKLLLTYEEVFVALPPPLPGARVAGQRGKNKLERRKRRTKRKNKPRNRFYRPQIPPMNFCAAVWRGQQKDPHNQTSTRTERRTRQDSETRACPKTTSKVHVVGLVHRSVDTTSTGEENKSMFRSGEVWSRQENATLQQAQRLRSTRPTRKKTKGRIQDYATGAARIYMESKHQTTTRKSAYSLAPPKPKSGVATYQV